MSYDKSCEALSRSFLQDHINDPSILEWHIPKLAQEIQDCIEAYIEFEVKP